MTSHPYVLCGLGNPGEKYALNRHNIGFTVLDTVARGAGVTRYTEKYQGQIAFYKKNDRDIIFFKPQTFMNLSGKAVAALMRFYKIPLDHLYVIHDELDLEPGRVKVKKGGGDGGHNGLSSITQHLGKDYYRIRIGIGHPGHKDLVTPHVLGNFTRNDQNWLEPLLWAMGKWLLELPGEDSTSWLNQFYKEMSL